jgi:hypothetical protein
MAIADWSEDIQEFGEELVYAALNLKGMDDDMVGHFTIEIDGEEFLVSIRKHKDNYYDKLADKIHKTS